MLEIGRLKSPIADALEKDGWTIEKLALTIPRVLTPIPGIGTHTAKYIIAEAQKIVNSQGREYSAVADRRVLKLPLAGDTELEAETGKPLPPMSERVKRIAIRAATSNGGIDNFHPNLIAGMLGYNTADSLSHLKPVDDTQIKISSK